MRRFFVLSLSVIWTTAFAAGPANQFDIMNGGNNVSVTGANGGQDRGQDVHREELSIHVADAAGPIDGAKCVLSNDKGSWSVTAPDTVTVRRSNGDLSVACEKPGYIPASATVKSSTTKIQRKKFRFSTDAGGDGDDEDDDFVTVPQYTPSIAVTLGNKATTQTTQ